MNNTHTIKLLYIELKSEYYRFNIIGKIKNIKQIVNMDLRLFYFIKKWEQPQSNRYLILLKICSNVSTKQIKRNMYQKYRICNKRICNVNNTITMV